MTVCAAGAIESENAVLTFRGERPSQDKWRRIDRDPPFLVSHLNEANSRQISDIQVILAANSKYTTLLL